MTRKFTILAVGWVALLVIGAVVSYAQYDDNPPCDVDHFFGDMMGGHGGMMPGDCPEQGFYGMGMMGGHMGMMLGGFDDMDRFGPGAGIMGGWQAPSDLAPSGRTLTLEEAVEVAEAYIAAWESEQALELGEVMQFDNHFYAVAEEAETRHGAFEFLIDSQSGYVVGEPGPNMMWNLKYGMGLFRPPSAGIEEMTVTVEEARAYAQAYLDEVLTGVTVDPEDADNFYGYYTLHVLKDGEIVGMLGVNGYTGQVWLHYWHGDFITMTEQE